MVEYVGVAAGGANTAGAGDGIGYALQLYAPYIAAGMLGLVVIGFLFFRK